MGQKRVCTLSCTGAKPRVGEPAACGGRSRAWSWRREDCQQGTAISSLLICLGRYREPGRGKDPGGATQPFSARVLAEAGRDCAARLVSELGVAPREHLI